MHRSGLNPLISIVLVMLDVEIPAEMFTFILHFGATYMSCKQNDRTPYFYYVCLFINYFARLAFAENLKQDANYMYHLL
jgi:hypothetical protein